MTDGGEHDVPIRISSSQRSSRPAPGPAPNTVLRSLDEEETDEKRPARLGVRLTLTAVVVLGLFTIMVGRLWSLQVLQTQTFKNAEINTSTRTVPITPLRGLIFARNGQLLVGNQVLPVVTLDRSAVVNHPEVIGRLAAILGMTVAQVRYQITDDQYSVYEPIPIEVGVPIKDILYLSEHPALFPGVSVSYQSERSFPRGQVAPELLGFVGDINAAEYARLRRDGYQLSDVVGQFGVESSFESWLRGHPGNQVLVVDPQGDVLGVKHTTPPVPGDAVVLSLDLGLQHELDQALAGQIAALRRGNSVTPGVPADWGAAVVMDPQNGQILAMSSYGCSGAPASSCDPSAGTYAIDGYSPPGSTFKLATATAALDDGLLSPYTTINDTGSFSLCNGPGCTFYNSPGEPPLGYINITEALSASDDVFFYNLGDDFFNDPGRYGQTPIQNMAARYGLGSLTGIDIPGEGPGEIDSPALYNGTYYAGNAVEMAFGQGATNITALQLADMYATFANGGTRYVPQVAAAVVSPTGGVVKRFAPEVAGTVPLPPATRSAILTGLEGAVGTVPGLKGTAAGTFAGFPLATFPLAGKTGTATTNKVQPNGLFVAFGPVPSPQYVVAVIIDQAGYGASTAAPVARQVFEYLLKHPVRPFSVPVRPAG
jgi:penicillin-binding protein 2